MKKKLIILFLYAALILMTGVARGAVFYNDECNNGHDYNTNPGPCGTACGRVCRDVSDPAASAMCLERVMEDGATSWTKYDLYVASTVVSSCEPDDYFCHYYGGTYTEYTVNITLPTRICSIGDKYYPERREPYLYPAETCACGSVGASPYKTCCVTTAGRMTPVEAECGSYCRRFEEDGIPPPEGNCPSGSKAVFGTSCPVTPTVNLTASCNADGTAILRWTSTGADRCISSDFPTGGAANNTTGVRVTDVDAVYRITCYNDYRYEGGTDSLSVSGSVTPNCRAACASPGACYGTAAGQTRCSDFDGVSSGTTIAYTPSGSSIDCNPATPTRDLCCKRTCGRCSTIPGRETTWVNWTDLNSDGDNIACNSDYYNERSEIPDDPRCVPPAAYFCDPSCSALPAGASCVSGSISGGSDSADNGKPCYSGSTCNNACVQNFYVCRASSCSAVSYATRAACEAVNGAGNCHDSAAACSASCGGTSCPSGSVTAVVDTPNPVCLPKQPGQITSTDVGWRGTAPNNCAGIIGGGSPDNSRVACRNISSNWSVASSGVGTVSGNYTASNINSTQDFVLECTRDTYTCMDSNSFSGSGERNDDECNSARNSLIATYGDNISFISTCASGSCDEDWPHVNPTTHCDARYCGTTHRECETYCPAGYVMVDGVQTCPGGTAERNCRDVCNYDGDCYDWSCRYYTYGFSVTSKSVPGGYGSCSATDSEQVRFMQKPVIIDFRPTRTQILLNQAFDMIWEAAVGSSGAATVFRCTPSISAGDPVKWAEGATASLLNKLSPSGRIADINPQSSTTYGLFCRNNDRILCGANPAASCECYNETTATPFEVKVFEPYLQETPPVVRRVIQMMLGMMREAK